MSTINDAATFIYIPVYSNRPLAIAFPAIAYVDAGTGSMIRQLVIAGVGGRCQRR